MENITSVQYLTALQGALRGIVAFCGLLLYVLGKTRQYHIPAFKYLQNFIAVMSIWGFFGGVFFICPYVDLLPYISPFIYASITFSGSFFMLFCVAYAYPHKEVLLKKLSWILVVPCIICISVLVPPLQKFSIIFTNELIYIPYRDILEHYHFLFYVHIFFNYATVIGGIIVVACKSIKFPKETTVGSRIAMLALALFVGQNAFYTFAPRGNLLFCVPSVAIVSCMILLFYTMYYDTVEQIIDKGQSSLLESLPFPVMILNNHNLLIHTNSTGKELLSSMDSLPQKYVKKNDFFLNFTVFDKEDTLPESLDVTSRQVIQKKKDKTLYYLQEQQLTNDKLKKSHGQMMMMVPLTAIQNFFSSLESKAFKDNLCGCYNRHYFQLRLTAPAPEHMFPISILMCDIDNLKGINDILGHDIGDSYIKFCYNAIRSSVPEYADIFRLGGDEFLVVLFQTPATAVKEMVQKIESYVVQYKEFEPHRIGISVGTATAQNSTANMEDCVKAADMDMYKVKAMRKGRA